MRSVITLRLLTAISAMLVISAQAQVYIPSAKPPDLHGLVTVTALAPSTVKTGTEITLQIKVENISGEPVTVLRDVNDYLNNRVMVFEVDRGKEAKVSDLHHFLRGEESQKPHFVPGKPSSTTLKPKESYVDEVILNKLYDLGDPGKYRIEVETQRIKSKPIFITVTP